MRIRLVSYKDYYGHVSQDTVNEFENAIKATNTSAQLTSSLSRVFGRRFLKKIMGYNKLPLAFLKRERIHKFCVIMGLEFYKCVLAFLFNRNNSIYFFDAWTHNHGQIEWFIKLMGIKNVFFSSRQVTEMFRKKGLDCNFLWVPEGISVADYRFKDYSKKDIDVLAFGRKYDAHHNKIVTGLQQKGISYLYEKTKGHIVFKDRLAFIDGLARTKISICVPSDITHPERSGIISTMTIRYLQSMASKTLIIGYMPEEMKSLFDYTPIVELDMDNPVQQITAILDDFDSYIPLIEKNYRFVKEHHTWLNRWNVIRQTIAQSAGITPQAPMTALPPQKVL